MFKVRLLEGEKVKILLLTSWVIVPVTPGVTVKVAEVMVAGSMASGNVAEITVFWQIPAEALGGPTETGGAGGKHATATVVKVHTKFRAGALPYMSWAAVVIVAVYSVLRARGFAGVKIAVSLDTS